MSDNFLEKLMNYEQKEGENYFVVGTKEDPIALYELSPGYVLAAFFNETELPFFKDEKEIRDVLILNNANVDGFLKGECLRKISYDKPSYEVYVRAAEYETILLNAKMDNLDTKRMALWFSKHAKEMQGSFSSYNVVTAGLDGEHEVWMRRGTFTDIERAQLLGDRSALQTKANVLNFMLGDYGKIGMSATTEDETLSLNEVKIDYNSVPIEVLDNGILFYANKEDVIYDSYGPGKHEMNFVSKVVSLTKQGSRYRVESSDSVNNEEPYVGYSEDFDSLKDASKRFVDVCKQAEHNFHGIERTELVYQAATRKTEAFASMEKRRETETQENSKAKAPKERKAKKTKSITD